MIDFMLFLRTIGNNVSYMCYMRNKILDLLKNQKQDKTIIRYIFVKEFS